MSREEGPPDTIDRLLAQISHFHHAHVRRGVESFGLYRGQPRLLQLLWEQDGLTHTQLANALQVQPATVSKTVQRMERSGFVERRRDPDDERVSRVYLTSRGRSVREQVESWFKEFEDSYTHDLSVEDQACLKRLLTHIRDRLVQNYEDDEHCLWPPEVEHRHGRRRPPR